MKRSETPKYIFVIDYMCEADPTRPLFTYHAVGNEAFAAIKASQACVYAAKYPVYCGILYERADVKLDDGFAYSKKMRLDFTGYYGHWSTVLQEETDLLLQYKKCPADAEELTGYAEFIPAID